MKRDYQNKCNAILAKSDAEDPSVTNTKADYNLTNAKIPFTVVMQPGLDPLNRTSHLPGEVLQHRRFVKALEMHIMGHNFTIRGKDESLNKNEKGVLQSVSFLLDGVEYLLREEESTGIFVYKGHTDSTGVRDNRWLVKYDRSLGQLVVKTVYGVRIKLDWSGIHLKGMVGLADWYKQEPTAFVEGRDTPSHVGLVGLCGDFDGVAKNEDDMSLLSGTFYPKDGVGMKESLTKHQREQRSGNTFLVDQANQHTETIACSSNPGEHWS